MEVCTWRVSTAVVSPLRTGDVLGEIRQIAPIAKRIGIDDAVHEHKGAAQRNHIGGGFPLRPW